MSACPVASYAALSANSSCRIVLATDDILRLLKILPSRVPLAGRFWNRLQMYEQYRMDKWRVEKVERQAGNHGQWRSVVIEGKKWLVWVRTPVPSCGCRENYLSQSSRK